MKAFGRLHDIFFWGGGDLQLTVHRGSLQALRVAPCIYLYSRSILSFVSMASVSVVVAARVLPPSSGPAVGSRGMPAASFMYPLKK